MPTKPEEKGGGCEDPRIIRKDDTFYLTYTAFDGQTPRLCLATSQGDLENWTKQSPLFNDEDCSDAQYTENGRLVITSGASKAGVIFPDPHPTTGKHVMIWGEGRLQLGESHDLIHWTNKGLNESFATGVHAHESRLQEPGPAPIKTKDGKYILIYNCSSLGGGKYASNQYSVSQMLVDLDTVEHGPVARLERPCLEVTEKSEREGQVGNVVFCEGVVQFKGKWWMYYGMGDAGIGVATCDAT